LVDVSEIVRVVELLDQRSGVSKDACRFVVLLTHQMDMSEGEQVLGLGGAIA
jgi:hypothetical protein